GWVRGAYYDATSGVFTPPTCLVGAIGMVCYGGPVDAPALNTDDPGFTDFAEARDWLEAYLLSKHEADCFDFNDASGRALGEVCTALYDAADAWNRNHVRQPAPVEHADYPHEPGQLYQCLACESRCYCFSGDWQCVYCATLAEHCDWDAATANQLAEPVEPEEPEEPTAACPDCGRRLAEHVTSPSVWFHPGSALVFERVYHCPDCNRWLRVEVVDEDDKDRLWDKAMTGDTTTPGGVG